MVHNTILCLSIALLIALPFAESKAYCTYHNYNSWDSLTTVACSDGANGVMTKLGYSDLSRMFPYVTAFSGATWNSPNCGRCVQVSSGGRSVFLTVIDQCGPAPGGFDAHFDISPPAFRELFGDAGVNAGVQSADWQFVDEGRCLGNRGNSGNTPSNNNPPPVAQPPPPSNKGHSNVRCGWNWGDANGKCGTPCTNDGPCAGQRCYADLDMGPCNRATEDDATSFDSSDDFTIDAAVADTASFETDEGNFVDDVSMNTETETVDAAIADVAEEEDNYVDNYVDSAMVDAAVADGSFDEIDSDFVANDNYVDAAVAGEGFSADTTQQQTQTTSAGMQGWMVAIIVVFTITTVLLLVVIVLAISVLRKH